MLDYAAMAAVVLITVLPATAGQPPQPPTLDKIRQAIKNRQDKIVSMHAIYSHIVDDCAPPSGLDEPPITRAYMREFAIAHGVYFQSTQTVDF